MSKRRVDEPLRGGLEWTGSSDAGGRDTKRLRLQPELHSGSLLAGNGYGQPGFENSLGQQQNAAMQGTESPSALFGSPRFALTHLPSWESGRSSVTTHMSPFHTHSALTSSAFSDSFSAPTTSAGSGGVLGQQSGSVHFLPPQQPVLAGLFGGAEAAAASAQQTASALQAGVAPGGDGGPHSLVRTRSAPEFRLLLQPPCPLTGPQLLPPGSGGVPSNAGALVPYTNAQGKVLF